MNRTRKDENIHFCPESFKWTLAESKRNLDAISKYLFKPSWDVLIRCTVPSLSVFEISPTGAAARGHTLRTVLNLALAHFFFPNLCRYVNPNKASRKVFCVSLQPTTKSLCHKSPYCTALGLHISFRRIIYITPSLLSPACHLRKLTHFNFTAETFWNG